MRYGKIAAKVRKILTQYGASTVLVRNISGGEYAPDTGTVPLGEAVRHPCKAVLSRPEADMIDGTTVLAGDMMAIIGVPGVPFIPGVGDALEVDGATWKVLRTYHVKPGDEYVLYKILSRK